MKRINKLSTNLVNQIAAGEVIERPASIVKELLENSIDAGSTRIEISISNECRNIRIADNGAGIHPDDIELAFTKHATSKIQKEEDLWNINTLGFRGEALASIISIAKVTCTTRPKDFEYGTKVESENSVIKKTQTGCAFGTIMEINDIFFNQPARLKFLKSVKTEFAYIQELVQSIALANPEVAFILKNNGQDSVSTTQNADLLTRITQIYSNSFIEYLKPIHKTDELSSLKITGFASIPSYTRSSKKSIYTFINSRLVKCPVLLKSIDLAYKNMLPSGKYPFIVMNLEISPHDIDVNAHPTKKEVRYKNPNQIFNFVQSAINQAISSDLSKQTPDNQQAEPLTNVLPFTKSEEDDEDTMFITANKGEELKINAFKPINQTNPIKSITNFNSEKNEEPVNIQKLFEIPKCQNELKDKIIGQYSNTYILIEKEEGLEIIDQHIADERYIYEKLKTTSQIATQMLLISDVIDLEASDVEKLLEQKAKLEKFGYKIEKISTTQIIFKEIPQILSSINPKDIIAEILENLSGDLNTLEEKMLITTSCKAAVKAGEKLSIWQMEELIKNWRTTKHPYSCPHGRPITKTIPLKEIAAFFHRNA